MGPSEAISGPLSGHHRGTQWLIRSDQRYSEALRGHQPTHLVAHPPPLIAAVYHAQEGNTPLHRAAGNSSSVAVVQALLQAYPEAAKATDKVRRPSPLAAWMRGPERSSEVIICNQWQSVVIIRNQRALSGTQMAISGTQSHSEPLRGPLRGHQRPPQWPSEVLSGSSEVIRGTQRPSEVIRDHSEPLRATQWHSEALRGPWARGLHRPSPCVARLSTLSLTSAPPTSSLTHLLSSLLCTTRSTGTRPFTGPLVTAHRRRWCRRSSRRTRRPPRRRTRYAAPPPLPRG